MNDFHRFRTGFYSIFIDFDVTFVWYSNDVAIKFRSIFDRLRDAFYNRIRYSCKILPFSVYRTIIPVSSGSMKTTSTGHRPRPAPVPRQPLLLRFSTQCNSVFRFQKKTIFCLRCLFAPSYQPGEVPCTWWSSLHHALRWLRWNLIGPLGTHPTLHAWKWLREINKNSGDKEHM